MKLLYAVVVAALPVGLEAQDPAPVLAAAESRYAEIRTLTAHFTQIIENPMLGGPEQTTGVLFLSPPGRFAMRFTDPEGDRIVADGEWLWLFNPSTIDDQVIRTAIPEVGAATPNLFAQFVDNPRERYHVTRVDGTRTAGRDVHRLRLVPKSEDLPFREATIHVDALDGMLRAIEVVEQSGQKRYLEFRDFIQNQPIPEAELMFTPPPGVRVVTPHGL
jgi:outer membrane lipoprotein carrier protein